MAASLVVEMVLSLVGAMDVQWAELRVELMGDDLVVTWAVMKVS